eukprot:m.394834 g.394834  ORF g.394834 m.394834 type:complete len:597 (-) comp21095_c0_seq1:316-2106(-)
MARKQGTNSKLRGRGASSAQDTRTGPGDGGSFGYKISTIKSEFNEVLSRSVDSLKKELREEANLSSRRAKKQILRAVFILSAAVILPPILFHRAGTSELLVVTMSDISNAIDRCNLSAKFDSFRAGIGFGQPLEVDNNGNSKELTLQTMSSKPEFFDGSISPSRYDDMQRFEAQSSDLEEWRQRIRDEIKSIPKYPQHVLFNNDGESRQAGGHHAMEYHGKGIVMSAGRRMYFTSAYVTIRALRDIHKCTLPIEVFYNGMDELPSSAISHMESRYEVKFVDITQFPLAANINLKGYQMKAFSIFLSSFEEVLWLDSDNIPLEDPSFLFHTEAYTARGALFWQDWCNMVSVRRETWEVFGVPTPEASPQPRENKTTVWPQRCAQGVHNELETGQLLINKKQVWDALWMILYLNAHHTFFLKRLFHGDKMTFHFGFQAVGRSYGLVSYVPGAMGIRADAKGSPGYFCGNTMAQRHPTTGRPLFMHRTMAKFKSADAYSATASHNTRAWLHYAKQPVRSSWEMMYRDELPSTFFVGESSADHFECCHPTGPGLAVGNAPKSVKNLETKAFEFLSDLENLPFYPKDRKCTAESMFFCRNA